MNTVPGHADPYPAQKYSPSVFSMLLLLIPDWPEIRQGLSAWTDRTLYNGIGLGPFFEKETLGHLGVFHRFPNQLLKLINTLFQGRRNWQHRRARNLALEFLQLFFKN